MSEEIKGPSVWLEANRTTFSWFGNTDQESDNFIILAPEYDVTQLIHRRAKRSTHTYQKNLLLAAFGKDIELSLQRNRNIISKNGLTVERRTHAGLLSKETHFPKGKFYVGHTNSGSESHVALRETARKGQLVRKHLPISSFPKLLVAEFGIRET